LILKTAKRIGYRPNLFAANLRSYRVHPSSSGWPVALIVFHTKEGPWYPNDPMLAAMRATAPGKGFQLLEYSIQSMKELRPLLKMLYARGVHGLILPSFSIIEKLEDIDWSRFSVVTCGRWDMDSLFHNVRDDPFFPVIQLWKELDARGYRRIGMAACRHPTLILDDLEREGAIASLQAREERGPSRVPPFLGLHGDVDGFLAWFAKYRPEAVVGFSDLHYSALKSAGYFVPGDCGYVSLQTTQLCGEVAGMSDAQALIGKTTMRLMDSLVRHHENGVPQEAETLLVRAVFRSGTSLPSKAEPIKLSSRQKARDY